MSAENNSLCRVSFEVWGAAREAKKRGFVLLGRSIFRYTACTIDSRMVTAGNLINLAGRIIFHSMALSLIELESYTNI